jgi:alanyl-tRNA synthetase
MTDRLYYADPYLQIFDATIQRVDRADGATADGKTRVTLDKTAFYPTSGGQPFDTGLLGALRVVDVADEDDGSIVHIVEDPAGELRPGAVVNGAIDWARRFDHMQQHTGQHVLSAAFDRLSGIRTVSFHLGTVISTIDLAREATTAELNAAEAEANRIVWEDRPVEIRYASAEEAARMPLRKESIRGGTLRLIDVQDFDLSACGGTHVARTGGIGVIAIAGWERFKGGQRIEFLCGGRALDRWRLLRDTVTASVRHLSVLPEDLPAAIEHQQAEAKEQKRAMTALHGELARHQAEEMAAAAESVTLTLGRARLVAKAIDADASVLKSLASAIAAKPGYVVILVSSSQPALAAIARSSDVPISAQQILAALTSTFGGRGGGKAEFAQGGGLHGPAETLLGAARKALLADRT